MRQRTYAVVNVILAVGTMLRKVRRMGKDKIALDHRTAFGHFVPQFYPE